jgi:hypothetical protein
LSTTRVYVPSTLTRLRDLLVSGGVGPVPVLGHAVTDAVVAADAGAGEEDWEYAAMTAAAQDSLGLLTEDDPQRRVVVVVDAESARAVQPAEHSLVELDEVVPVRAIAAVHVDDETAATDVTAARAVWGDAENGDPVAVAAVERCLDHELGWFAAQEIAVLLEM